MLTVAALKLGKTGAQQVTKQLKYGRAAYLKFLSLTVRECAFVYG
jgi:hypothetical protein